VGGSGGCEEAGAGAETPRVWLLIGGLHCSVIDLPEETGNVQTFVGVHQVVVQASG
jgi:hypothetical protein